MISIDRNKLRDLYKTLTQKCRELDATQNNLTMPIAVSLDDLIWLLESHILRKEVPPNE